MTIIVQITWIWFTSITQLEATTWWVEVVSLKIEVMKMIIILGVPYGHSTIVPGVSIIKVGIQIVYLRDTWCSWLIHNIKGLIIEPRILLNNTRWTQDNTHSSRWESFVEVVALRRADWLVLGKFRDEKFNRRIRRGCVLASSEHRRRPWPSRSFSWRARCRWLRHGSRSPRTPWELRGSPRRWGQRYAWLHHGEPDDG